MLHIKEGDAMNMNIKYFKQYFYWIIMSIKHILRASYFIRMKIIPHLWMVLEPNNGCILSNSSCIGKS